MSTLQRIISRLEVHAADVAPRAQIRWFRDYHEIFRLEDNLRRKKSPMRAIELNTEDYGFEYTGQVGGLTYPALYYTIGHKPNDRIIKQMFAKLASKRGLTPINPEE